MSRSLGQQLPGTTAHLRAFIEAQPLFFVGTAAPDGRVNVSPKGLDSLRVLGPNRVVWLSVTGSGNETAAHLLQHPRMTLMFCAFEGPPLILRLYGRATMRQPGDEGWAGHLALFPALPGTRQLFVLDVDLVQTSCGMAVPLMTFEAPREDLNRWAERQGDEELHAYRARKNRLSLDGYPTGLPQR
ncbi:pyridoxamine 5'-phosphate oxidase family protein [Deinococcus multiflagellatus]|uniref:Pyridoxamine 5'-phosphate oxidase family protein n=1 Tax=Deinococcus multiflagellatus TaxID=1656887 RepID=A0ABW1ZIL9_9DEIO|nr:pyridoxamine 5'-phosphate oxidase family protein [Deinococcus multiflagellatus]MBZ9712657.1 pyridoxamine 5'-phosphate oxidase family protein [Deinococcus multiflagellatus]